MNNFHDSLLKISRVLLVLLISISFSSTFYAQDGGALFNQNCASCHHPLNNGTGPALKGAKAKWEAAGDNIYAWVKNPESQIKAGVKSALAIKDYDPTVMPGQAVSEPEIDAIFKYIDSYTAPVATASSDNGAGTNQEEGSSNAWLWWLIIGVILLFVIISLWGVRRQLEYANQEKEGQKVKEQTLDKELKGWAWRNMKLVSVLGFLLFIVVAWWGFSRLYEIGVFENYVPDQPIAFTHKVHAGDNNIDCQYCHNSASKSKHAGIPTVNVCMNCHKAIKTASSGDRGTAEIAKIHKAAGYDPEAENGKGAYTGNTEPIKWVKAHNLPDHVYFSHAQHVAIGKIECENCHGPVKTYTVGRTASTEMINNMELKGDDANKNIIKLSKPLLTMGWCIECHNTADVKMEGSEYYDEIHDRLKKDKELYKSVMEDGKVKVKELGGWECAKCHY